MKDFLPKKCHLIGIGGIGMSGLARILLKHNVEVSGSDCHETPYAKVLAEQGARISSSHSASQVDPEATVIFSTSIASDNVEFVQAKSLGCPVLHRSELLQRLMATRKTLAVTGTHGKTTTTALLSAVLKQAECDPPYMVGGVLSQFNSNADWGEGEYFVAEADESDGSFLRYAPYGAIITNIGGDHLDHFGSDQKLYEAFAQFAGQVASPSHFFWCGDDPLLCEMNLPGFSYGFDPSCDVCLSNYRQDGWNGVFDLLVEGKPYLQISCPLPGRHNALNAAAVFGLALKIGCSEQVIRQGLKGFQGVQRRCEKKWEAHGILFLDDYAHHPTELAVTLGAIRRAIGKRRLIAIFQPHRYSRMEQCFEQLSGCFEEADLVWVTDIYSAGETPRDGISPETIAKKIGHAKAASLNQLADKLHAHLRPHDVVVTLGAGDVTYFGKKMREFLDDHPPKKLAVGLVRGGASYEHDISLVSAKFIEDSLSSELYEVIPCDIPKSGEFSWEKISSCDVMFPVLHGPFGEDGTIQGLFEMVGIPYVGCSHRSSAIAMDKALTKQLAALHGVRTLPFVSLTKDDWKNHSHALKERIVDELTFPVFVKGLHLGSSIGVIKAELQEELDSAIKEVLKLDTGLIVEQGIRAREIEFAVLGCDEVEVFPPGEVFSHGEVYDFEAKYSPHGMKTTLDPELTETQVAQGCRLARRAYNAIGCDGMARVDFFLDERGKFWLNEINPMPGMTSISLFPQLCIKYRYSQGELMDQLIILGLSRHRNVQRVFHGTRV